VSVSVALKLMSRILNNLRNRFMYYVSENVGRNPEHKLLQFALIPDGTEGFSEENCENVGWDLVETLTIPNPEEEAEVGPGKDDEEAFPESADLMKQLEHALMPYLRMKTTFIMCMLPCSAKDTKFSRIRRSN